MSHCDHKVSTSLDLKASYLDRAEMIQSPTQESDHGEQAKLWSCRLHRSPESQALHELQHLEISCFDGLA